MPASERAYVSGHFALQLGKESIGFLKSVEGGYATAEVVTEAAGPSFYVKKHLGGVSYEPVTMQIDLNMAKPLYDWIDATWKGKHQRKDGSIIALDAQYKSVSEQKFQQALITEVTVPAMDGSSKEAAFMTVKLVPEIVRNQKGDSSVFTKTVARNQKRWTSNNFRLEIDGLDCQRVSRIDSFVVKQKVTEDAVGASRDYQEEPTAIEFPNLAITLSEVGAQSWYDWHEDFVIKGNNDEGQEKNGALIFLMPDFKTEIARIHFFNLGIFKLAPVRVESLADQIRRITAQLYCERMEFELK